MLPFKVSNSAPKANNSVLSESRALVSLNSRFVVRVLLEVVSLNFGSLAVVLFVSCRLTCRCVAAFLQYRLDFRDFAKQPIVRESRLIPLALFRFPEKFCFPASLNFSVIGKIRPSVR